MKMLSHQAYHDLCGLRGVKGRTDVGRKAYGEPRKHEMKVSSQRSALRIRCRPPWRQGLRVKDECPVIGKLAGTHGDSCGTFRAWRRRRWASSEKARIVEESLRQGAVVTAAARRHEVHPNLLHHWRRQTKRPITDDRQISS